MFGIIFRVSSFLLPYNRYCYVMTPTRIYIELNVLVYITVLVLDKVCGFAVEKLRSLHH